MEPEVVFLLMILIPCLIGSLVIVTISYFIFKSGKVRQYNDQEAQMVQEIYQGIEKLEKRITDLELVIAGKERGS